MKRFLTLLLSVGILSVCSYAQDPDSAVILPTVTVSSIYKVNDALDKAFRKGFPNAHRLRWYRLNKDYLAKFIKDDMKHQTLYRKNGYMEYDISYGMLHDLPVPIYQQVEGTFRGYNITRVAKVIRNKQEFWIINLEGIKDFVVVRAEDGDLEEVKRVEKSDQE